MSTWGTARFAETGSERRSVLLAHIMCTLVDKHVPCRDVEDAGYQRQVRLVESDMEQHIDGARTIALHSVAVLPQFQKRGLGSTLVKGFIQMVKDCGTVDRIILVTRGDLVGWYENFGFINLGKSDLVHGQSQWFDLVGVQGSLVSHSRTNVPVLGLGIF